MPLPQPGERGAAKPASADVPSAQLSRSERARRAVDLMTYVVRQIPDLTPGTAEPFGENTIWTQADRSPLLYAPNKATDYELLPSRNDGTQGTSTLRLTARRYDVLSEDHGYDAAVFVDLSAQVRVEGGAITEYIDGGGDVVEKNKQHVRGDEALAQVPTLLVDFFPIPPDPIKQ